MNKFTKIVFYDKQQNYFFKMDWAGNEATFRGQKKPARIVLDIFGVEKCWVSGDWLWFD